MGSKKRQRGGKNKKRQRGGVLGKKTTKKVLNEFTKAGKFISQMADKGIGFARNKMTSAYKKIKKQGGGTTVPMRRRYGRFRGYNWGNSLGSRVEKYYM